MENSSEKKSFDILPVLAYTPRLKLKTVFNFISIVPIDKIRSFNN